MRPGVTEGVKRPRKQLHARSYFGLQLCRYYFLRPFSFTPLWFKIRHRAYWPMLF